MKNTTKRMFALIVACAVLFTANVNVYAYAATNDGAFSSSSDPNRQSYTPVNCHIMISETSAWFQYLKWENVSFGMIDYWEGELRVTSPGHTIAAGTLPFLRDDGSSDPDDRAFVSTAITEAELGETYYVTMSLTPGPKYDDGVELMFESETGLWMGLDGIPTRYQGFTGRVVTGETLVMSW